MTQWDANQTVSVDSPAQVHFALQGSDECLIVESKDSKADVPNVLLQDGRDILFWTVQEGQSIDMAKIAVSRKPKPSDYVYTETEILSFGKLEADVKALISQADTSIQEVNELAGRVSAAQDAVDTSIANAHEAQIKADAAIVKAESSVTKANQAFEKAQSAEEDARAAIAEVKATEAKLYPVAENVLKGTAKDTFIHVDDAFPSTLLGIEIEGACKQDGTPSPDNPVPIQVVENPVVKVTGRNLLNPEMVAKDSQNLYAVEDGHLLVKSRDGRGWQSLIQEENKLPETEEVKAN